MRIDRTRIPGLSDRGTGERRHISDDELAKRRAQVTPVGSRGAPSDRSMRRAIWKLEERLGRHLR